MLKLQDIHKEAVGRFYGANNPKMEDIADFYDKKIVEILKDSIPDVSRDIKYQNGSYSFKEQLIENLKARNINLD